MAGQKPQTIKQYCRQFGTRMTMLDENDVLCFRIPLAGEFETRTPGDLPPGEFTLPLQTAASIPVMIPA
jgi:hypothetical protein